MVRKRQFDPGLRRAEVTEIVGCDTMTVVNWETGHTRFPQISHIAGVVGFLGFDPLPLSNTIAERFRTARGMARKEFAVELWFDRAPSLNGSEPSASLPEGYLDRVRAVLPDIVSQP
jgi:hypothetical protein